MSWIANENPSVSGWYVASNSRDPSAVRYWDGMRWSAPAYASDPPDVKERCKAAVACLDPDDQIEWQATAACLDPDDRIEWQATAAPFVTAPEILTAAAGHIADRAATYDKPEGERSVGRTVEAFNAITGHTLAESEGWLFLELLKAARDYTTPGGHADSQEDRVAYAALAAEARRAGR